MTGIPINGKGLIITSIICFGVALYIIVKNSKDKQEYEKTTGQIEYFDKQYQNLHGRNKKDYRYLKIDSYQYIFELYEPNSVPTENKIDDLKIGDSIEVYYYENSFTRTSNINRFIQFIDKNGKPYFIRNNFQVQLGYVLIGLGILVLLFAWWIWKKKKSYW